MGNVALYQHAKRTGMTVRKPDPEKQDKLARATPVIVFAESGRLWLPAKGEAPGYDWDAVEAELLAFTGDEKVDEHDDVEDTLTYAVKEFGRMPSKPGLPWAYTPGEGTKLAAGGQKSSFPGRPAGGIPGVVSSRSAFG